MPISQQWDKYVVQASEFIGAMGSSYQVLPNPDALIYLMQAEKALELLKKSVRQGDQDSFIYYYSLIKELVEGFNIEQDKIKGK